MLFLPLYRLFLTEVGSKENKDGFGRLKTEIPKAVYTIFFRSPIYIIILNCRIVCLSEVVSLGFGMQGKLKL